MNSAKEDLSKFILTKIKDKDELISVLDRLGLNYILLDLFKNIDKYRYTRYIERKSIFKLRNTVFRDEIIKISNALGRENIKVINWKGMTLANSLYSSEEDRDFCDIDILVKKSEFIKAANILMKEGYCEYVPPYSCYNLNNIFDDENPETHHLQFNKKIYFLGRYLIIPIELHFTVSDPLYLEVDSEKIIDQAVKQIFYDNEIWVPNVEDMLFCLIVHYLKHISIEYNMQLSRMHDIALFIDKYKENILWNNFEKIIKQYNIASDFVFFSHIFKGIYSNRLPSSLLYNLSEYALTEAEDGYKFYMKKLTEYSPAQLIFENSHELIRNIVIGRRIKGQEIICKYLNENYESKNQSTFIIDEYGTRIENRFGTYVSHGKPPKSSNDCSACGNIFWDLYYFYVNIRVYDDILVFRCDEKQSPYAFDSIELLFANTQDAESNFIRKHIVISPNLIKESVDCAVYVCDSKMTLLNSNTYEYKLYVYEDGYEITLKLPWGIFEVKPYSGFKFGFDVVINDCDDPACGRKTRLSWSSNKYSWDIRSFGEVTLT